MNGRLKRYLIIGTLLAALCVGAVIFLFLPFAIKSAPFFIGFIACLVLVLITFIVVQAMNRKRILAKESGEHPSTESSMVFEAHYSYSWLVAVVIVLLGGLASGFIIYKQSELAAAQIKYERIRVAQQSALIESVRNRSLVFLMKNILDKVDDELKDNPERILSDETISRIAALSHSLKPYTYFEGDSVSMRKLSPERGQLLIALSQMEMDTTSWNKIFIQATFAEADMKGAILKGAYFKKADLNGANFMDAELNGANLTQAKLIKANFWGSTLTDANLALTNLKRADLSWVDMTGAILRGAELNGTMMRAAVLRDVNMSDAIIQWADVSGTFFNNSDLAGINLRGTKMNRVHLNNVNLARADLRITDLSDAVLIGADLNEALLNGAVLHNAEMKGANLTNAKLGNARVLGADWLRRLDELGVASASIIQAEYEVEKDESGDKRQFKLAKIENQADVK